MLGVLLLSLSSLFPQDRIQGLKEIYFRNEEYITKINEGQQRNTSATIVKFLTREVHEQSFKNYREVLPQRIL